MIGWWILFATLAVLALGLMPSWPYSKEWGYYPAGILWLLDAILLALLLTGAFERA